MGLALTHISHAGLEKHNQNFILGVNGIHGVVATFCCLLFFNLRRLDVFCRLFCGDLAQ
jgi:hypothetical protein